jgi:hypothetical protein
VGPLVFLRSVSPQRHLHLTGIDLQAQPPECNYLLRWMQLIGYGNSICEGIRPRHSQVNAACPGSRRRNVAMSVVEEQLQVSTYR